MTKQKLGIATKHHPRESTVAQLDVIKRVGFDGFFTLWYPELTEAIANRAAQLGLIQQSIHAPWGGPQKVRFLWEGSEEAEFATNSLIECVHDCARFDIPVMVIHPYVGFHDHTPTQVGLDYYARIVEAANKAGVMLGFENVEGEEYLAALMQRFWNEPCLGFCYDSGHELCYNEGRDMLALYGKKLCHTHLNDNLGIADGVISPANDLHLMPGDGIADWPSIMKRIRDTGYSDILMCELLYTDRPGKNGITHKFSELSLEEFLTLALQKIQAVVAL